MHLRPLLRAAAAPTALALALVGSSVATAATPSTVPAGAVTVSGTGRIAADGAGVARIRGTFVVTGAMSGGTLLVDEIGRATAIRVTGWRSRTRVDGDSVLYRDVHGVFTIAGRRIVVTIASPRVRFAASGTGAAWLRGVGRYRVDGAAARAWPAAGAWIAL